MGNYIDIILHFNIHNTILQKYVGKTLKIGIK